MTTSIGKCLEYLEGQWNNLRAFAYKNRTIFEIIFILTYTLEQLLLIVLVYLFSDYIEILVTVFALIVITTFSFHKLVMESRIKLLEEEVLELEAIKNDIKSDAESMHERYNDLLDFLKTRLNKRKSLNSKNEVKRNR